ncbi:10560_t:CDS:2 [Entrophospora sp. SA101]|nr:10560_t:CDS:2 [Entrophospora sp. SA101]
MKAILEEKYQDLEVSKRTVCRELSNLGYVATLPRKVPLLTEQAKINRFFRNTMLAWSREKKPVQPMVKHPLKVLDWGAINFKGKVGIHIFTENLDRHLYRKILNEQLYNNADALVGGQWVFQQDNDPKYTSRDVMNDLNTRLPRRVLALHSHSPDLNPIENIWAILKHNVEKHVKKMIAEKKREEWEGIEKNFIVNSIGSMQNRVQACIDAEGAHTK